jgi:two-component system, LytTR family, sensor kinase
MTPAELPPTTQDPARGADALPGPRRWVEPALILTFWTAMAAFTAIGQSLDPRSGKLQPMVPAASVAMAFSAWYLWAALTPLIFRLSRRFPLERAHWPSRVAVLLGAGVGIAMCVEAFLAFLFFEVFFTIRGQTITFDPFFGMRRFAWLDDLVVYLAVLSLGFARDYLLRLRAREREAVLLHAEASRLQAEAAQHRAEAAQLEAQLADARLDALRRQLDPHFLFNTLNAVSSLVGSNPRGVRRMVARLSALLRHSLEGSSEPEVPLAQELEVLRQYVEIMEIRFEGRLQFETRADPAALDALVPNLILQPLVENAITHGVGRLPTAAVGVVEVGARREGDAVVLTVRDNGPALDDAGALSREGGVGLRNTRERLAQLYGSEHAFALAAGPGGGVIATVTLPYHTRADLRAAEAAPEVEPVGART